MKHYHVIRNIEGYMPENEPFLTTSFKRAHKFAADEIRFFRESEWDIAPMYGHVWHRTSFDPPFAMWRGSRKDKYALDIVLTIDPCNDEDCYEEYLELIEKGYI